MSEEPRPRGAGARLITIEGIEGAGKSTQVGRLRTWLEELGIRVVATAEPGGTPLGLRLRRLLDEVSPLDPLAECFLFAAARAQHVRRVICPALGEGAVVLCDRYVDSTTAYQGYGRGVALERIAELNRMATDGLMPDLTIVLDLDAALGLARARTRAGRAPAAGTDPFEGLALEFHERVRKGFWAIQAREPERVALVDADRAPETVAADLQTLLRVRLGVGRAP